MAGLISLLASSSLLVILYLISTPFWQTNDDVAMSMISQGYGIATYPSSNLVFSHVLWGHIVRLIPPVFGIDGYSIATVVILVITGAVIAYGTHYFGAGWPASLALMVLVILQAALFPQFTVNAGLLTIGVIICLQIFSQNDSRTLLLWFAAILLFLGYLVRDKEALLVFFVAFPLVPWRSLAIKQTVRIMAIVFIAVIAISSVIEQQAYKGKEWQRFKEWNSVRIQFTDYGAAISLRKHPEILTKYGYSTNDINLISTWFSVDPEIADPNKLEAMLSELGHVPSREKTFSLILRGLKNLLQPSLQPLFVAGLLLALLFPNRNILVCWMLFAAAIFSFACMGRPGMLRVYYPCAALLTIAPLLLIHKHFRPWRRQAGIVVLFVAAACSALTVLPASKRAEATSREIQKNLAGFPTTPIVVWGGSFPYERVYPMLKRYPARNHFKFYGLGSLTHAPFTVATAQEQGTHGFLSSLSGKIGVAVILAKRHLPLLEVYCKERRMSELKEVDRKMYGKITIRQLQCKKMTLSVIDRL